MDGQYKDKNGYWRYRISKRAVHREIYESMNGHIPHGWHIHHVDGDKNNNVPANLIALKPHQHIALHRDWCFNRLPTKLEIYDWLTTGQVTRRRGEIIDPIEFRRHKKRQRKLKKRRKRRQRNA